MKNKKEIYDKLKLDMEEIRFQNLGQIQYRNFPEVLKQVKDITNFLNKDASNAERNYCVLNDIYQIPICIHPDCNNLVKFDTKNYGYKKYCCQKCQNSDPNKIEKTKKTFIKKFGVDNPMKNEVIKKKSLQNNHPNPEKAKKTLLKRYGATSPMHVEEFKQKQKKTVQDKYNVDNVMQLDKNKKIAAKNMSSIGYENLINSPLFINKFKALFTKDKYNGRHDSNYSKYLYPFQCKKCKTIFMDWTDSTYKTVPRCPKCHIAVNKSSKEMELVNFIKENINRDTKLILNDKTILSGNRELDIYLPDKKIAIEFDGLYWHSEKHIKDPNYHLNKTIECEKQGIHLIHIFGNEWDFQEDIVKSKLLHILGEDHNPSIYARKCYIEEINSKSKNEFLLENHIQGADKSNLKLGLWYPSDDGDELVAVMTFCNLRKSLGQTSKKGHYELSRFATAHEYRIVGGFGKLWKYFCNNYEFEEITTYADRRWTYSKDNVYTSNFSPKLDHISKANYWYYKSDKLFHRYKFRKSELKKLFPDIYSDDKTEKEIMEEAGYSRIYDCGNLVFKYKNKS